MRQVLKLRQAKRQREREKERERRRGEEGIRQDSPVAPQ